MGVGNDIVDLGDAGQPSPRFVARVLAPEERPLAERGGAAAVWRLWAAKEAAFKVLARADRALPFVHRKFVVDLDAGVVRHPAGEVRVSWQERDGALACVAWDDDAELTAATAHVDDVEGELGVRETEGLHGQASLSVRLLCKRLLCEQLGAGPSELEILRPDGGPPEVFLGGRRLDDVTISLAHDGAFVACAMGRRRLALP